MQNIPRMMNSLLGLRFNPTEEELICYYLKNKITGQPSMEWNLGIMMEMDIYGDKATPWELFKDDNQDLPWQIVVDSLGKVIEAEKILYVFTKLSNVGKNGNNKQKTRVAGCGTWHANTAANDVRDRRGKKIGTKRTFTYKSMEETAGQWTMYEYTIDAAANGITGTGGDYVLCRIKRDCSKTSKGGKLVSRKRKYNSSMVDGVESTDQSSGMRKRISTDPQVSSDPSAAVDDNDESDRISTNEGANVPVDHNGGCTAYQEIQFATETSTNEEDANIARGSSGDDSAALQYGGLFPLPSDAELYGFAEENSLDPNICFDLDTFISELENGQFSNSYPPPGEIIGDLLAVGKSDETSYDHHGRGYYQEIQESAQGNGITTNEEMINVPVQEHHGAQTNQAANEIANTVWSDVPEDEIAQMIELFRYDPSHADPQSHNMVWNPNSWSNNDQYHQDEGFFNADSWSNNQYHSDEGFFNADSCIDAGAIHNNLVNWSY